jgi:hypothetical protein
VQDGEVGFAGLSTLLQAKMIQKDQKMKVGAHEVLVIKFSHSVNWF